MDEIEAEGATSLPNKEVMSLLDVNANVDLGLDLAAPVDLAAAANLNVAAPIQAAASANLLSADAAGRRHLPAARHDRPGHQRQRRGDGAAARRDRPELESGRGRRDRRRGGRHRRRRRDPGGRWRGDGVGGVVDGATAARVGGVAA